MDHADHRRQFKLLNDRLDRIEQVLKLAPLDAEPGDAIIQPPPPTPIVTPPAVPTPPPPIAPPVVKTTTPAPAPPSAPTTTKPAVTADVRTEAPPLEQPVALKRAAASSVTAPPPAPPARAQPRHDDSAGSIEAIIGIKVLAWAGALVIIIGVGFLVKLGIDAGLWGKMPAGLRCGLIAAFGGLLIGGGELALRRIGKAASAGLYGAGLGVLYLDAFAAFNSFHLLSETGAFLIMALVALIGFICTWRTRFFAIGAMSLIGGYCTPILIGLNSTNAVVQLMFLTTLLGIALALSAVRPKEFRPLRIVAITGQLVLGLLCIASGTSSQWLALLVFMSLWWGMVLAETLLAALRGRSRVGNAVMMLIATGGFITGGCWLLAFKATAGSDWLGAFTAAAGVLAGAVALQFGNGAEALRRIPRSAIDMFTVALWAQFGVLMATAAALQFDGYGQSISWLAVALASIEIGRRLPSRGVDIFGFVIGALALLRIATVDYFFSPSLETVFWSNWGVHLTGWGVLAVLTVLVCHVAAHRLNEHPPQSWRVWKVVLACLGSGLWLIVCLVQCENLQASAGWLLGSAVLFALHRHGRYQRLLEIGVMMLGATTVKWLMIDELGSLVQDSVAALNTELLLNGQVGIVLAIVGLAWWASRLLRNQADEDAVGAVRSEIVLFFASLLLMAAAMFEWIRFINGIDPNSALIVTYGSGMLQLYGGVGITILGGGVLTMFYGRGRVSLLFNAGTCLIILAGGVWLMRAIGARVAHGMLEASPFLNWQCATGVVAACALTYIMRAWRKHIDADTPSRVTACAVGGAMIGLIGIALGSLEIERMLGGDRMSVQAGLSIFWTLYAIMLIIIGFARRLGPCRYAGLGLLALTAMKILFIDLSTLDTMWRVISFLATGVLLVITSLLYARLSPLILGYTCDATDHASSRDEGDDYSPPHA